MRTIKRVLRPSRINVMLEIRLTRLFVILYCFRIRDKEAETVRNGLRPDGGMFSIAF